LASAGCFKTRQKLKRKLTENQSIPYSIQARVSSKGETLSFSISIFTGQNPAFVGNLYYAFSEVYFFVPPLINS
jgi:hypothetical protein